MHYRIWHNYEGRTTILDYAWSKQEAEDKVSKLNRYVKEGEAEQYFYRRCGCNNARRR